MAVSRVVGETLLVRLCWEKWCHPPGLLHRTKNSTQADDCDMPVAGWNMLEQYAELQAGDCDMPALCILLRHVPSSYRRVTSLACNELLYNATNGIIACTWLGRLVKDMMRPS